MIRILSNPHVFPGTLDPASSHTGKPLSHRILRAGYICDIIRDTATNPPIFHWVVQHCETNEIMALGQAQTLTEAEHAAIGFLDDLRLRRAI